MGNGIQYLRRQGPVAGDVLQTVMLYARDSARQGMQAYKKEALQGLERLKKEYRIMPDRGDLQVPLLRINDKLSPLMELVSEANKENYQEKLSEAGDIAGKIINLEKVYWNRKHNKPWYGITSRSRSRCSDVVSMIDDAANDNNPYADILSK